MTHRSPDTPSQSIPLPSLRPGVMLVGEGDEAELRDMRLGQVVRLGAVASVVVGLLDGTRDTERLLLDAAGVLGEQLNPLGLIELLQALDRRALLDTPRARMIVAQGMVRADIAALNRLSRRTRGSRAYLRSEDDPIELPRMAEGSAFECRSCARCCSERHLLGPVTRAERDRILRGFEARGDRAGSSPSNFVPLPTSSGGEPLFLLRPSSGFCSYLGPDKRCRVHSELGEEAKPAVCRLFPFRGVRTPDGWDVGMSLSCPTVASGGGPDPRPEARRTLQVLRIDSTAGLRQIGATVMVSDDRIVPFAQYRAWEGRALARLADPALDPRDAWIAAVDDFCELARSTPALDVSLQTAEMRAADSVEEPTVAREDDADVTAESDDFVPHRGIGAMAGDPPEAADLLLRDLALWAELLVGLEAADPPAIRRLRSAMLRLRMDLAHTPGAAPVLAERARLRFRELDARAETDATLTETGGALQATPTPPSMPAATHPDGADPAVQRRFLSQALLDKRLFDYSTVDRGLIGLTVLFGALRLPELPGDELHASTADIAYLVHHPQLIDIVDSRAVVRSLALDSRLHRAVLAM